MTTSQINARIDAGTKAAGDAAFSDLGYSPTRVIRLVWDFAGRNRHDRTAVRNLLKSLEKEGDDGGVQAAAIVRIAESGPALYQQALEEMGVTPTPCSALLDYDELLAQASFEKMAERDVS